MTRTLLALAAAALLALTPLAQARAAEPRQLVIALYAERNLGFDAARSQAYFARDLDAAMRADVSRPDEVGALDFDYRYGAQDFRVTGLHVLEEIDHDQAKVVAVFKNFGRPESVEWLLCRRSDGDWRIADASSNSDKDPWDLRGMLRLSADQVSC